MHTTVVDREGLVELFQTLAGRRFLGAIDCADHVELVFEGDTGNLVTIETSKGDPHYGNVFLGFVAMPEEYIKASNE